MISSEKGMTLLEITIATIILAIISVFTANSIQQALRSKVKVEKNIERITTVRDALRVMERDINLAFHYRDLNVELYNLAEKERIEREKKEKAKKSTVPGSSTTPPVPPAGAPGTTPNDSQQTDNAFKPKTQKLFTHFVGEENRLDFVTLSYTRIRDDEKASDQAEVGYFLRSCTQRLNKKQSSNCLWRRVDPLVDEDVTKGGTETVLLENITRFELRYLGPEKTDDWLNQWKSNSRLDSYSFNKFPYEVEITLGYHDQNTPNEKPISMTIVATLHFPNNTSPEEANGKTQESGTDSQSTPQTN